MNCFLANPLVCKGTSMPVMMQLSGLRIAVLLKGVVGAYLHASSHIYPKVQLLFYQIFYMSK